MNDEVEATAKSKVLTPKVGILTFHFTTNYGGVLQAFALSTFLSRLGLSSEIIDYRPLSGLKKYAQVLFLSKDFMANLQKTVRFWSFLSREMQLSPRASISSGQLRRQAHHSNYELIFVGSDEVWKLDSFRGYDPSFFLEFAPEATVRASFAASAGDSKTFGNRREAISQALGKYSAISVRDEETQAILERECQLHSKRLLDPTLLVDFPPEVFGAAYRDARNYFLIYGRLSRRELNIVHMMAQREGASVISVGDRNPGVAANFVSAGPKEWLALFRGAAAIFTVYFHGVVFGLKLIGEVYVFDRPDKRQKISQLKRDLDLSTSALPELVKDKASSALTRVCYSAESVALLEVARTQATDFVRASASHSPQPSEQF